MRIAVVSEHASPLVAPGGGEAGGQSVHVACLARALGERGHDVVVYTRRAEASLPARIHFAPNVLVEHVDAGPPEAIPRDVMFSWMDDFAWGLKQAWRRFLPDVVHSHFWMSGWAALRARRDMLLPVAHTCHALGVVRRRHQGAADTSPAHRLDVEEQIVGEADWLICTSRHELDDLRGLGARSDRLSLIPSGVDLDVFRPEGERWIEGACADGARVLVLGRMAPRKGVDDVIRALAMVPGAELVVAGGPPRTELEEDEEVRRLLRVASAVGVAARVRFLGRVDRPRVPALIRAADVVVSVPWYEPFGLVPLEAMACGVPVVAAHVGGIMDTVVDGVTGDHVPPGDPEALALALQSLLEDPSRRQRYGEAGAARARARYGWRQIASSTIEAYTRMLGQTRTLGEELW